ncbi:hypothetical protein ACLOJK_013282 [Asimina triloba]
MSDVGSMAYVSFPPTFSVFVFIAFVFEDLRLTFCILLEQESKQNLKILPVFITIDPQRDSPSHLQAYLQEFDPRIIGLTGPVAAIRQIAQEYRVFFKKFDEDGDELIPSSQYEHAQ